MVHIGFLGFVCLAYLGRRLFMFTSLESLVVKVEGARFKNPRRLQRFAELLPTDLFPKC